MDTMEEEEDFHSMPGAHPMVRFNQTDQIIHPQAMQQDRNHMEEAARLADMRARLQKYTSQEDKAKKSKERKDKMEKNKRAKSREAEKNQLMQVAMVGHPREKKAARDKLTSEYGMEWLFNTTPSKKKTPGTSANRESAAGSKRREETRRKSPGPKSSAPKKRKVTAGDSDTFYTEDGQITTASNAPGASDFTTVTESTDYGGAGLNPVPIWSPTGRPKTKLEIAAALGIGPIVDGGLGHEFYRDFDSVKRDMPAGTLFRTKDVKRTGNLQANGPVLPSERDIFFNPNRTVYSGTTTFEGALVDGRIKKVPDTQAEHWRFVYNAMNRFNTEEAGSEWALHWAEQPEPDIGWGNMSAFFYSNESWYIISQGTVKPSVAGNKIFPVATKLKHTRTNATSFLYIPNEAQAVSDSYRYPVIAMDFTTVSTSKAETIRNGPWTDFAKYDQSAGRTAYKNFRFQSGIWGEPFFNDTFTDMYVMDYLGRFLAPPSVKILESRETQSPVPLVFWEGANFANDRLILPKEVIDAEFGFQMTEGFWHSPWWADLNNDKAFFDIDNEYLLPEVFEGAEGYYEIQMEWYECSMEVYESVFGKLPVPKPDVQPYISRAWTISATDTVASYFGEGEIPLKDKKDRAGTRKQKYQVHVLKGGGKGEQVHPQEGRWPSRNCIIPHLEGVLARKDKAAAKEAEERAAAAASETATT